MQTLDSYIMDHSDAEDAILLELNRKTHLQFTNPRMLSGVLQGNLLYLISCMMQPLNILEIGTFTGYSAICLARGLKRGGNLITIDINDELFDFASSYFEKAGLSETITFLKGDALKIVPTLKQQFDLVFIDGEKSQYLDYYHAAFEKIRPGGIILADNVLWNGNVVEKPKADDFQLKGVLEFNEFIKQDKRVEKMILPLRDGLMLIRKKEF
jgi:caffeoyl-CoA O-methyltransferase